MKKLTASKPVELLNVDDIRARLNPLARSFIKYIAIFARIASTNTHMLRAAYTAGDVCLAEMQTAGRGRCGKSWHSPFAQHIYCSVLWSFACDQRQLPPATLVVAIAVARLLARYGLINIQLKWPNDVYVSQQKIAGILLEIKKIHEQTIDVVIGIGLNVQSMPSTTFTAIADHCDHVPSRSELTAALLNELCEALCLFNREGLSPFLAEWRDKDFLHGKSIVIQLTAVNNVERHGIAAGIDDQGRLIVTMEQQLFYFDSGEIILKK